tara:strand:+ start:349 stop:1656 length:1308 start_codon:yes stop_codon:yes gene_type:complete
VSRFGRRGFLIGSAAGGLAALLPWTRAHSQELPRPKRLVLFFTPHGTLFDSGRPTEKWLPTGTERDFTLHPLMDSLVPFQDQLIVTHGIAKRHRGPDLGGPHTTGMPILWSAGGVTPEGDFTRGELPFGWNSHASVDQLVAQHLATVDPTPFDSMTLGVASGGNHPGSRMIYAGPGMPVTPLTTPQATFDRFFAGSLPGEEADRERARRLSVLDAVRGELTRLSPRMGTDARRRLEAHTEAIRSLERGLQSSLSECAIPDPEVGDGLGEMIDKQSELLATGLACGLTRVGSIQCRVGENDGRVYDFLGHTVGHHSLTHREPDEPEALEQIHRFYFERFAALLGHLARFPEGDGTLLDHTLVVWGSDTRGWDHNYAAPFIFAGGGRSGVPTGRWLEYGDVEHNRMLVSLAHHMGLTSMETIGDADEGAGPLSGLLG